MGCRTEPAAVHIAHVLQRLHFFQFFNFFYNLHDLPQKKIQFFFIIHTTYQKKLHAFTAKKNYMTKQFFCTRLTFFSDLTQHAKGRMVDCLGPHKDTTTRRNVTQGGVCQLILLPTEDHLHGHHWLTIVLDCGDEGV